jgi:hypothetical protein
MARNHGRILASAWAPGSDFRTLDRSLQGMYFFLLSQPNLNHAGLLPITLRKWAACASGDSPDGVEKALIALHDRRYIVIDWDTEELLIRTLVRNDGIWKQPKVMLAMVGCVEEIESPMLRRALLAELERLPLDELKDEPSERGGPSVRRQVENCIRSVRALVPDPDGDPSPDPSGRLSDTHTDTQSETLPDTHTEGHAEASTRARAGTHDARSPAPAPAPAPIPDPVAAPAARDAAGPVSPAQLTLITGLPADEPPGRDDRTVKPETEGQRVFRLARTYTDRVKLSNYNAVAGVVKKAVRETDDDGRPRYTDRQIEDALTQLRESGWGVSTETLRRALERPPNANRAAPGDLGGDEHMARFLARQAARRAAQ